VQKRPNITTLLTISERQNKNGALNRSTASTVSKWENGFDRVDNVTCILLTQFQYIALGKGDHAYGSNI
jgi:hypothetical protein